MEKVLGPLKGKPDIHYLEIGVNQEGQLFGCLKISSRTQPLNLPVLIYFPRVLTSKRNTLIIKIVGTCSKGNHNNRVFTN